MDIFITVENFPTKLISSFKQDLKEHNIKADVQERPNGTVLFSCTTNDVTEAQIFTIIIDKYRFAKEGETIGEAEEEKLCLPQSKR